MEITTSREALLLIQLDNVELRFSDEWGTGVVRTSLSIGLEAELGGFSIFAVDQGGFPYSMSDDVGLLTPLEAFLSYQEMKKFRDFHLDDDEGICITEFAAIACMQREWLRRASLNDLPSKTAALLVFENECADIGNAFRQAAEGVMIHRTFEDEMTQVEQQWLLRCIL